MRKYEVCYLSHLPNRKPDALAIEHLATFMEGVTLDGDRLIGSNDNIRDTDSLTVFYVPNQWLPDFVSVNSFLIEVFDYYMEKHSNTSCTSDQLHISAHKTRVMLGRAANRPAIIQLHPVVVESAQKLAHEFMCLLQRIPFYRLRHMDIGSSFVILVHGPK